MGCGMCLRHWTLVRSPGGRLRHVDFMILCIVSALGGLGARLFVISQYVHWLCWTDGRRTDSGIRAGWVACLKEGVLRVRRL